MDLLVSKDKIIQEINLIISNYQENSSTCNEKIKEVSEDLKITNDMNNKLIKEIEEKDKILSLSIKRKNKT